METGITISFLPSIKKVRARSFFWMDPENPLRPFIDLTQNKKLEQCIEPSSCLSVLLA